jgi:hypothetical protein
VLIQPRSLAGFRSKLGGRIDPGAAKIIGPGQGKGSADMERHELRELVEDALAALKPRYQRTRTPMQRLWERRWGIEPATSGGEWWRFGNTPPPVSREI